MIYNPFYFYLLSSNRNLNSHNITNDYYKNEIFNIIINNLILVNRNLIKYNKTDNILTINSIIILIKIYNNIMNDSFVINVQLEKNIIYFLEYIFGNYYIFSKIVFDIYSIDEYIYEINIFQERENTTKSKNNEKKNIDHKLILEISLDIIFQLLNKGKMELLSFLKDFLKINDINSIFFKIDELFLLEENKKKKNSYKYKMINLLNSQKIITEYCSGININSILVSIYFLIYFINEKTILLINYNKEKDKIKGEIINLINKILLILFNNCLNIFKIYSIKIKKNKNFK